MTRCLIDPDREGFMGDLVPMGKGLMVTGLVLTLLGLVLLFSDKIPFLGRLPGDLRIERAHSSFYFPLTTCLLLSAVLSLILWVVSRTK